MIGALFATAEWMCLAALKPRDPSRCPYCPSRDEVHWTKDGSYRRWAPGRREKIRVQCYYCPQAKRWFSLLPDGLLPHRYRTAAWTLRALDAMVVEEMPVSRLAELRNVARSTLRRIKAAFFRAVTLLRLPGREGRWGPSDFLKDLAQQGAQAVASLFTDWKELEPKHSVLGLYAR
jgi:transposase-like protein